VAAAAITVSEPAGEVAPSPVSIPGTSETAAETAPVGAGGPLPATDLSPSPAEAERAIEPEPAAAEPSAVEAEATAAESQPTAAEPEPTVAEREPAEEPSAEGDAVPVEESPAPGAEDTAPPVSEDPAFQERTAPPRS